MEKSGRFLVRRYPRDRMHAPQKSHAFSPNTCSPVAIISVSKSFGEYRFIDRMTILISQAGDSVVCEMTVVKGGGEPSETLIADFKRELLDQALRLQIKEETAPARDLILAYAFSRTGLQGCQL